MLDRLNTHMHNTWVDTIANHLQALGKLLKRGNQQLVWLLITSSLWSGNKHETPEPICTSSHKHTHGHPHTHHTCCLHVKWGPDWQLLRLSSSLKHNLFLLSVLTAPNWQPAVWEQLFSSTCLLVHITHPPKRRTLSVQKTLRRPVDIVLFYLGNCRVE